MNRFAATTVLIVLAANVKAEEPFAIQIDSPQLSEAELLGSIAGRILGAAQTCGLNSDRLQSIARRVFAMIDQVGKDQLERISASERMRDGLNLGRDDVTAGRSTCKSIRSALAKLENQVANGRKDSSLNIKLFAFNTRLPMRGGQLNFVCTVSDRIAQMVVKRYLEPRLEAHFHEDSYGYRPRRSAHDALRVARQLIDDATRVLVLDAS